MAKEETTTETEEPKKMNRFFRLWLISMISAGVAAVFKGALSSSASFGLLSGLLGWFAGIIFVGGWIAAIIGLIIAFFELAEEKGWELNC